MEENTVQENQTVVTPPQAAKSSKNPWKILSLVIIFLVLSGGLVFAGVYIGQKVSNSNDKTANANPTVVPSQTEISTSPTSIPTEEISEDPQVTFFPKPIKVPNMGLITMIINGKILGMGPGTPEPTGFDYEGNSSYYKIGIMKVPEYKDMELYLLNIKNVPGMFAGATNEDILRFIKNGDKFILLDKNSNLYIDDSQNPPPSNIVHEENFVINSLIHEPLIALTYQGKELIFEGWSNYFGVATQMEKLGKIGKKDFYKEVKTTGTSPIFKEIGDSRLFYLKYPDTSVAIYTLSPQLISSIPQQYWSETQKKNLTVPADFQINWTDGLTLKSDKNYGDGTVRYNEYNSTITLPVTGAGKITYYDKTIDLKNDLVKIGSNPAGEEFFGLKDKNHIIYTDFYKNRNDYSDFTKNMTFEEFVAQRPMFFWKDLFGDYHGMFRGDFELAAGIAKPAIYLYPEKEATVSVQFDPSLTNVTTIPAYNGRWTVIAEPNGTILASGSAPYDYLFYEGDKKGFVFKAESTDVVKKVNVPGYLEQKLASLGLNEKERRQFIEYWEPKMRNFAFYKVSFMGTTGLQKAVPLYISPQPTTLIRILMKYTGMKNGTEKIGLFGTPVNRVGFTVVEWGGLR